MPVTLIAKELQTMIATNFQYKVALTWTFFKISEVQNATCLKGSINATADKSRLVPLILKTLDGPLVCLYGKTGPEQQ